MPAAFPRAGTCSRDSRKRLERVEYFRTPDLWIFTTRTAQQDALYQARRMRLVDADAALVEVIDHNTEWIERHQLGVVLRSFSEITAGIEQMLDPERLRRFQARAGALHNRAVFEIPNMLETLIEPLSDQSETDAFQALARYEGLGSIAARQPGMAIRLPSKIRPGRGRS